MNPLVVIVGRQSDEAKGVRGKPFAAGQAYFRAVERAGGTPLMLPPIPGLVDDVAALLQRTDAVVFHGGGDIDPRRYGQEATEESLYGIVPEHDAMEMAMITAAIAADKPVLAICRGLQVLNVALGGTLVQDIGSEDHWLKFTANELEPGPESPRQWVPRRRSAVIACTIKRSTASATGCVWSAATPVASFTPSSSTERTGSSAPSGIPRTPPPTTPSSRPCSTN